MNLNSSFSLDEMMRTAQTQMIKTRERLGSIAKTADEHLGGRSRGTLLGAVAVSLIWAGAFLAGYLYFGHYLPQFNGIPLGLVLLGVTLALVAFVVIGNLAQLKYYGTILSARDRLNRLDSRLAMGLSSLPNNLQVFRERRRAQWELPLDAAPPIEQEAGLIASQLAGMDALSHGFIAQAKKFLYYAACIVWTVVGSYTLLALLADRDPITSTEDLERIGLLVALVIACIIEMLIAKTIRNRTGEDVGNVTLLALFIGPVVYIALILLAMLVIALLQVIIEIAAIIIGIACVLGSISGG